MVKHLIVFITLLTVLIFIAGCPQAKLVFDPEAQTQREPIEPNRTETLQVPIHKPEPNEVELTIVDPSKVELPKFEPNDLEPTKIEPLEEKPHKEEPNDVQYIIVEPNEIELGLSEPNKAELATVEPNDAEPNKVEAFMTVSFHDKCASILNSFVDEDGMVDYSTLRRKRLKLKKLLNEFDELDPNEYNSWPKEDKIAFWINAYNIQMLNIIVANYPIDASRILSLFWGPYSIRHIKGIWTDYKFIVMDEEFTLREIQQRFFRKEFDEPRIYFALSYASFSSPPLRNEPYYGYKLREQLEEQSKRFLSSPRAFKINRDKQTVYLSAILQSNWHGEEFVDKFGIDKKFKDQQPVTRAVLNFITNYISEQDVSFLEVGKYSVEYIKYDWTLNEK